MLFNGIILTHSAGLLQVIPQSHRNLDLSSHLCVTSCFSLLQAIEGELQAYDGLVKELRKKADHLVSLDKADSKEITAKQVNVV